MSVPVDRLHRGLAVMVLCGLVGLTSQTSAAVDERCHAEVKVPARYREEPVDLVVREASTGIDITPARMNSRLHRILVRDRSSEITAVQPRLEIETRHRKLHSVMTRWVRDSLEGEQLLSDGDRHDLLVAGIDMANVEPGHCVIENVRPARVEIDRERVLMREATEQLSVREAEYERVVEDIVVQPAYQRLIEVPTVWRTVSQREIGDRGTTSREVKVVERAATTTAIDMPEIRRKLRRDRRVRDAYEIREPVAAAWGTIEIPRTVKEASYVWHVENASSKSAPLLASAIPSSGEGRDRALEPTGRRLCHRIVPARTVSHERLVEREPGYFERRWRSAEYESREVEVLVADASQHTRAVPPQTEPIEQRILLAEAHREWHAVPCEGELTTSQVRRLQQALRQAGHEPGAIDGVPGPGTLRAVTDWQKANALASGALTLETLRALGVTRGNAL